MDLDIESPIELQIGFGKLLQNYEQIAQSKDVFLAKKAERILAAAAPFPELREGLVDVSMLKKHEKTIKILLEDIFPEALTHNEIKVASFIYNNAVFYSTKRFQKIIGEAGPDFELEIGNLSAEINYMMAANAVLAYHYGFVMDFRRPLFFHIPDAKGVTHHYRILYNGDFMELIPTEKAKELSQDDFDELMASPDDLKLWKEKIPPNSFISRGFVIANMFDVTAEYSISEIKSNLISMNKEGKKDFMENMNEVFRSLFNLPDIRAGFVIYNAKENQFEKVHDGNMGSFLLNEMESMGCKKALTPVSYQNLLEKNTYFAISNVDRYLEIFGEHPLYKALQKQGIKSAILAPIGEVGEILGVLELVSKNANELNSINAGKLEDVMPYIVAAVKRKNAEHANLIDAVIQNECTSVHPSVYWRFQEEAERFIAGGYEGKHASFSEIVFKDVYPLYGQVDIKDSSQARNLSIQRDLMIQLSEANKVLGEALQRKKLPIYEEMMFRVNNHLDAVKETLHTNGEQAIFNFFADDIHPVFEHLRKSDKNFESIVLDYESGIDSDTKSYYDHRRNYDESVMGINKEMVKVIDKRQEDAQSMYPHYFERYKTDGIEHNIYIGDTITGKREFDLIYLNNLRLWQLQVMCEMENTHYKLKGRLPVPLDVTSLILVYNTSLSIRFRMDEKRFDVDGTYNARYEVIKKRIDKSLIRGSRERLTKPGKMVVVYSQKKDELEYLRYIKFLKSKGYFTGDIEIVELEGLQGVSGLKAIRAGILYHTNEDKPEKTYTYEDLMEELKA